MAKASNVSLHLDFKKIPLFNLTMQSLEAGHLTKAHRSNAEYTQDQITFKNQSPLEKQVLFDPQTSGGLLLSVDPTAAPRVLKEIKTAFPSAQIIGVVKSRDGAYVAVE
jgi:selenide,water dikinase